MTDEQYAGDPRDDEEGQTRGGALRLVLSIVLVIIIILLIALVSTAAYYRVGPEGVKFVKRNTECLKCHTEVLDTMRKNSMHVPYQNNHCTSCHTQHSNLTEASVAVSVSATGTVTTKTWVRWGPFRWLIDTAQSTFGVKRGRIDTQKDEAIGEAGFVVPLDQLCWTCHGNLREDRERAYAHQPFASSHCLSCHDPHASDSEPLLRSDASDLCMTCHPIGRQMGRGQAHRPVEQKQCLVCHEAHSSEYKGMLVSAQRDLCFGCHPSVAVLANDSMQHGPFENDDCTGCHEPHGSAYRPLLIAESPDLCYECHTQFEKRFQRASHHPVGTRIDCSDCHKPHATNTEALLVKNDPELCKGCHSDISMLSTLSVQHEPFTKKCTDCHVPHGSKYGPLLNNPQPNLCYQCHPDLHTAMTRVSHHPTQCTRCHRVHAGEYPSLLFAEKGNDLCYNCHPAIKPTFSASKHVDQSCMKCHNPHGSRFGSLMRTTMPDVCTQCHTNTDEVHFNDNVAHNAKPRFYDRHARKPLTCTSTCHNPHGTSHAFMLRKYGTQDQMDDPLAVEDGVCLDCHPGVGIRF